MNEARPLSRPILHERIAHAPWQAPGTARLPGTVPILPEDWLTVDGLYAAQMAERECLLAEVPGRVLGRMPGSERAVAELYDTILASLELRGDFRREGDAMRCPDGRLVRLDTDCPLETMGRLLQEDLCLLDRPDGTEEHVLVAAVLCFPANWTLAEKLGRPLVAIHAPVPDYDGRLATRVQRLFDGLRPVEAGGRILMRMNALDHGVPDLHQTRREADARPQGTGAGGYLRIERQCLRRLPETGAVVFSIHTSVLDRARLTHEEAQAFARHAGHAGPDEPAGTAAPGPLGQGGAIR